MEDEKMNVEDMEQGAICAVHKEDQVATSTGINSAWMRRHFSDSIYLWAFGEKADDEDFDPTLSERFIAWLILFLQGFAYTTLIFLASLDEDSNDSYTSTSEESFTSYSSPTIVGQSSSSCCSSEKLSEASLLPAVVVAMYLLFASTTHDLRAGFSLLVGGLCAGHRAFGVGLLIVHGVMLSAAMTVIVSTSEDTGTVVTNAVAVIFVADLDEKALKFLLTIPQQWRVFWAIYSIGISFALGLIAAFYAGGDENIFDEHKERLESYESWFFWMLNPAGVTMVSYRLSACIQGLSEWCSKTFRNVDQLTFRVIVAMGFEGVLTAINRAKQLIREEPCFYAALAVWTIQGVFSWSYLFCNKPVPVVLTIYDKLEDSSPSDDLSISKDIYTFTVSNAALAAGLAVKAVGAFLPTRDRISAIQEPRRSSDRKRVGNRRDSCATDSRVPVLLVGWGIGYWVTSLLFLLGIAWHNGGWKNAPVTVEILGYVLVPCFFVAGIFMVADTNFLGEKIGAFIEPAVNMMRDRRRFVYWAMVTVLRDGFFVWVGICNDLIDYLVKDL